MGAAAALLLRSQEKRVLERAFTLQVAPPAVCHLRMRVAYVRLVATCSLRRFGEHCPKERGMTGHA